MDIKIKLSGSGGIPTLTESGRAYAGQNSAPVQTRRNQTVQHFDCFTSSGQVNRNSFEMELRGKITQDVRTATSSGMIAAVREEIQSGTYQPDPVAIARKMLLIEEET